MAYVIGGVAYNFVGVLAPFAHVSFAWYQGLYLGRYVVGGLLLFAGLARDSHSYRVKVVSICGHARVRYGGVTLVGNLVN